ncbi:MAG: hypothetical protein F4Z82_17080 [Caldilineaceae bacterium SB0668_bin_21]|nr:hypothetical protein [Caldilineaceae bacterium SB0668_bin_21]
MNMAKKRKSNKKPRAQSTHTLEELLMNGEKALYGQICWAIANRSTEKPRPGEVITLEGGGQEGGAPNATFRLTDQSIENIGRCLGMRTCGEALALFAGEEEVPPNPSREPTGECRLGHQEAALAYMMYGVEPTKPCPDCGEIPRFSNPAMGLGFAGDGPVRGVDGREYTECPQCGDDLLELQGNNPLEWGWKIVCLNCGWKMKQAEGLDIDQYCELMEDAKGRVEAISHLMDVPGITIRTRVESVCLQLRMLLELIVFSSLVSNKDVWQRSRKELQSSQDISKKLRELKRLHPNFYPRPIDLQSSGSKEPSERTDGFLSEDDLIEVYGRLGNILHAENPMGEETDYRFFIDAVPGWLTQVANLLECHKVHLYHRPEEFYLVKMFGDVDGELLCIRFKLAAEGKTKCAWPNCVSSTARLYCEYIQRPWRECRLPEIEPAQTEGKRIAEEYDGLVE